MAEADDERQPGADGQERPSPYELKVYITSLTRIADARPGFFLMIVGIILMAVAIALKVGSLVTKTVLAPEEYIATLAIGFLILASGAVLHAVVLRTRGKVVENAANIADAFQGTRPRTR